MLLAVAERTIAERGIGGLSLRGLAADARTTTRAVYSLFGSKEALLGDLGARAFKLLREGLEALPQTADPQHDLVEAALMFRRFALEHPALFSIGIQRTDPSVWPRFREAATDALEALHAHIDPLARAGRLGGRTVPEAAFQFHALCEGLAAVELRGMPSSTDRERYWRSAFDALISGFASS